MSIGILGLSRTGLSVFKFLHNKGKSVICYDDNIEHRQNFINKFGDDCMVDIENQAWQACDKIVVSPGIPHSHKIFTIAKERDINITSDIELFLQNNQNSKFILITGTNGKSTTTALIGHILKQNGLDFIIGGNIGLPVLDLPQNKYGYVLELSSFQLELLGALDAEMSVITNITPDHLDRHGTMDEYVRIKKKILHHNGIKILGIDNEITANIYKHYKLDEAKKVIGFSANDIHHEVVTCTNDEIIDNFFDKKHYKLPFIATLVGRHNAQNIATSFAVSRVAGIAGEDIIKAIISFPGLEHRMQFVSKIGNISFYNDSKATNTDSAKASLSALDNIFWLVGGIFKEDYLQIEGALSGVRKAYVFGQDRDLFSEYLFGKKEYVIVENMEKALQQAYKDAITFGNECNILLAPACASYDQFKNYEDRGHQFMELVKNLK
jgi:UDP-N-acetylmuramoylalanine--D-glutamate ligase